ncbi:DUF2752 domain-containing protein [Streptomyces sp. CA-111067]|uniref:DUF2752 domain-containing protein n=1 Tax=Streptomyces sp. CA-111067 TaxID=3240046 RepID=UPI003D99DC32
MSRNPGISQQAARPAPEADPAAPAAAPAPAPTAAPAAGPVAALRRAALPLAVLGGVAAGFGYVATVDPNAPGHYPACPLLYYTGLYCPGCGGLRGAYALAHGRLCASVGCNALAVAGYVIFAMVWAVWAGRAMRGRRFEPALRPGHRWAVYGLVLVFTVVRNLPFGAALAP